MILNRYIGIVSFDLSFNSLCWLMDFKRLHNTFMLLRLVLYLLLVHFHDTVLFFELLWVYLLKK